MVERWRVGGWKNLVLINDVLRISASSTWKVAGGLQPIGKQSDRTVSTRAIERPAYPPQATRADVSLLDG